MVVKNLFRLCLIVVLVSTMFSACRKASGDYPGDQYTYDMISSRAYETYSLMTGLPDSMSALLPVNGTVPFVGNAIGGTNGDSLAMEVNLPYAYANTPEDYERAGVELKNPYDQKDPKIIAAGMRTFNIYCSVCHGAEGDGKGFIVTEGKFKAVPPSYYDAGYIDMPDGKMFHSMTYGKNAMQSYAYALSKADRWKVIAYINSLPENYLATASAVADTMETK